MRYTLAALAALCVFAVGCKEVEKKNEKPAEGHQVGNASSNNATVKMAQNETETDRQISQSVRKALADNAMYSQLAKNVRVHTRDGVVHLRGTVNSNQDKQNIAAFVNKIPGVKRVENYLDVSSK